ncbi:MAG TPA: hypothetical protein ENH95_02275 [Nitrosopumilus sp.]|nr:hypothetical protein [Nitrosopumilus sp.]
MSEAVLVSDLLKWVKKAKSLVKEIDLKEQREMMKNGVNPNNPEFKGYRFWKGYQKALNDFRKQLQEKEKHGK